MIAPGALDVVALALAVFIALQLAQPVLADWFIRELSDDRMASRSPQLRSARSASQASVWPLKPLFQDHGE